MGLGLYMPLNLFTLLHLRFLQPKIIIYILKSLNSAGSKKSGGNFKGLKKKKTNLFQLNDLGNSKLREIAKTHLIKILRL